MKRVLHGCLSLLLLALAIFLAVIIVLLVQSEVMPAVAQGSLSVRTQTRILNRVWVGNEIYLLLSAYAFLSGICAYWGVRQARKAMGKIRRPR